MSTTLPEADCGIEGYTEAETAIHPGEGRRVRAGWAALSGVVTAALMAVMYGWDNTFFLVDDKRNQYLPAAMDIGRRLLAGEWLPVIDPNLGISGNYSLDIQYGLYNPLSWPVDIVLSRFSDLQAAAFLWALVFEVVLAVGTTSLALRLRMTGAWAATAGVAAATSGWVLFWLAPDWIPGLVSLAWLPWLWWAWVAQEGRPRVRECVGIAVFGFLVIVSGWPATWLALGALVVGLAVESLVRGDAPSRQRGWLASWAPRLLALLAGVSGAALSLVPLYRADAAHVTIRGDSIANTNFLTANLADMLSFAAPQLNGDLISFGGQSTLRAPIFFVAWFAVVVLWTTRWHAGLWRRPGLVTCVVGGAGMLLLTQAPSVVGPLRDQIRELGGAQLFFAVAVCSIASAGPWVVTRVRLAGILLTLVCMGWISWSRTPSGPRSFVGILVVAVCALLLVQVSRRLPGLTAGTALATTFGVTVIAFLLFHAALDPAKVQTADSLTPGTLGLTAADEPILAIYPAGNPPAWDQWQTDGVGRAFSDLRAVGRSAPGYSSISQRYVRDQLCIYASQGQGCPQEVSRLFQREPVTHTPWVDLLGYRTIVVAGATRQHAFEAVAGPMWHQVQAATAFTEYRRPGPASVAGRVTHVIGHADVSALSLSREAQSYQVSSQQGATLIFRDIYWPGYHATLNGHPLAVTALDRMLVTVRLPAGAHGTLRLSYIPLSTGELVALPVAAVLLLAGAADWVYVGRRRDRATSSGESGDPGDSGDVDGDEQADQPADRERLQNTV